MNNPKYQVLLLNNSHTWAEAIVIFLTHYFKYKKKKALELIHQAQVEGSAVLFEGTFEEALNFQQELRQRVQEVAMEEAQDPYCFGSLEFSVQEAPRQR